MRCSTAATQRAMRLAVVLGMRMRQGFLEARLTAGARPPGLTNPWVAAAPGFQSAKTTNRVAALLRLAAVTVGKSNTALGAFYRRLGARIGKAKAVTATARKIAVLFYNAMRFGMKYVDPGADHYEQRYKERVIKQLHRRAAQFGFSLQPAEGVS